MERTKWLDRNFNFNFPAGLMESIIVRLSGTIPHINYLLGNIPDDILAAKDGEKWSIKEHTGHLAAVENLHIGRIEDIRSRSKELRPAGFNQTGIPGSNDANLKELISRFDINRKKFISLLDELDDEIQNFSAFHPRLKLMMRPVDVAYFAAEHDDHHLAAIYEILRRPLVG